MENLDEEFNNYWETNMFLQTEEFDSYFDESINTTYYDSSSPDGNQLASKNIVSERNRRKKLNDRMYALRSVVPNITKMDKASIIRDAIEHIESLNDEEKRIQAEICELESGRSTDSPPFVDFDQELTAFCSKPKRSRMDNCCFGSRFMPSPVELLELRVSNIGERTMVVSLTCYKRTDTMVKLCQMFESLKLKIITANITDVLSGRLLKTVFLEADEEEKDLLRLKIEAAIATLNDPDSPMSI